MQTLNLTVTKNYDTEVLVVGGGVAGISAAISAFHASPIAVIIAGIRQCKTDGIIRSVSLFDDGTSNAEQTSVRSFGMALNPSYSITAEPCMESATCCGMELIAKQSYGIKPQKNAPLVMPYAYGDTIHANA